MNFKASCSSYYYQVESATFDTQFSCPLCIKNWDDGEEVRGTGPVIWASFIRQTACLWADGKDLPPPPSPLPPPKRSPHCLVNMLATYNILEEKLVDFVSACHRYMYVRAHDVIRFIIRCSPHPLLLRACSYKRMSGL